MKFNTRSPGHLEHRLMELDVDNSAYLGPIVSTTGGAEQNIRARRTCHGQNSAHQACSEEKLTTPNSEKRNTKVRIFKSNAFSSALLWGTETW